MLRTPPTAAHEARRVRVSPRVLAAVVASCALIQTISAQAQPAPAPPGPSATRPATPDDTSAPPTVVPVSEPATAPAPEPPARTLPPPIPVGPDVLPTAPIRDVSSPGVYRSAGYHNGSFFIHSPDDVFRLYVMGRVHADWLDQIGPGTGALPPGNGINDGFFLRRARLELAGEFFETWQWQLGAEFASATTVDNPAATQATPTCTADPKTSAVTCSNKENPVEAATTKPIPTDVFVNYGPSAWANLEVGQFYLPFTLENRISDNTTAFLERSLAVRDLGAPLQRDIGAMFWGESPDRTFYYAAAVVNGDGPNRVNVDARYDFVGRAFVRPLATIARSPAKWAQLGVSAKYGSRDPAAVAYDLPSLTTQGGFAFWKPTYKDSLGRTIHVLPSNAQWGLAGDVYVPIDNFDLTGEFVYMAQDTREAVDGLQLSPFTERLGSLKGFGWYVQAGYWIFGDHDVLSPLSYGRPIHVDLSSPQRPAVQGVQVLAKFEQLHLDYEGSSRGGVSNAKTPNGDIDVQDVELGINYWATKHLRVSVNYALYLFPDSAPVAASPPGGPVQSSIQRAVAPGQLLAAGVDNSARDTGHTLHEVSARVGVQF
ncbi:MAG TPA: porin [Polyangiaceae bacterium]|nr:porin [Polyangiaceae bacterium]